MSDGIRKALRGASTAQVTPIPIDSSDPRVIAASVSERSDVVGAFVIVQYTDGGLALGLAGVDDEHAMRHLLAIAGAVNDHCDKNHGSPVKTETPSDN